MKSTGIVRNLDRLGRIVIPIELRKVLGLNIKDPVEISMEGKRIILEKYSPSCIFCGESENISCFNNKMICKQCSDQIKSSL